MAQIQYYIAGGTAPGSSQELLGDNLSPPSSAYNGGWSVDTLAAGQSIRSSVFTTLDSTDSGWGTTLQPDSGPQLSPHPDSFRSAGVLNCTFASGNWSFQLATRSFSTAYTGRFKLAVRVWKSTDPDGAGATELTSGRVVSSATTADLSASVNTNVFLVWSAGAQTFTNEYLFFNVGLEVTTAAGGSGGYVKLMRGPYSALITPDFVDVHPATGALVGPGATVAGTALRAAPKTYYQTNTLLNGFECALQDGGSPPSAATANTRIYPGANAAGQSVRFNNQYVVNYYDSGWSSTLQPDSGPVAPFYDSFRSVAVLTGTFANSDWTFKFATRGDYNGRFKLAVRVFRSTSAAGVGATELTSGRVVSAATTADLSSSDTVHTITWSPGASKTLTGEYLFFTLGLEITTAGTAGEVDLWLGQNTLVTSKFTPDLTLHPCTTGAALVGPGATVAGTAQHKKIHATSGALTGAGSTLAGTAALSGVRVGRVSWAQLEVPGGPPVHACSGALTGQGSTVAGTAHRTRTHACTGALAGQGATVAGTSAHKARHACSGALTGQSSTVAGTASRTRVHACNGALTSQGATLSGTAAHIAIHATSGALVGQWAAVDGDAARASAGFVTHDATGALTGQGSTLSGTAHRTRVHDATGVLPGHVAVLAGVAQRLAIHVTSGALVGPGSVIAGTANHKATHVASGDLTGQPSVISGIGSAGRSQFSVIASGAPINVRVPPQRVAHVAAAELVGQGSLLTGSAMRYATGMERARRLRIERDDMELMEL